MPNYICMDERCRARGKTQDLVIEVCPLCGGPLAIIADDEFIRESFSLHGTIDQIKYFLESKMIRISELQKTNEKESKRLQLEVELPDVYVQCMMAKICDVDDCPHSKPHEPELFETTTCRHGTHCQIFKTRCIPFPEKIG